MGKKNDIEKLKNELAVLKIAHREKVKKLKHDFEVRLADIEKIHQQQVETERNVLINSWRWRIGDLIVTAYDLIKDLYFRCIGFFSRKKEKIGLLNNMKSRDNRNDLTKEHTMQSFDRQSKPMLACIFDTFTYYCFKNEFNIISISPDNYKHAFNNYHVDAFLCESAWKGNQSSWRFHIGKLNEKKKGGLKHVLFECKNKNIPSIFWNKEDPVHFDHFIDDAKSFDYIFTTDELIIPKYQKLVGHKNVYALPFAAQEKIHNPIRSEPRDGSVCFAGTHYNTKYAERIIDMRMILHPAMDFGLEIYDRNYGATGHEKIMYGFPEIYRPFIKGKLEYSEMIRAYKKYKVFLNINSVKYSPTMLSRRVFELLACGTPVISTYSEAIENLLGLDTVVMVETEEDTRRYIEKLLTDDHFWWEKSLCGIRRVLEHHTYHMRKNKIFKIANIYFEQKKVPCFLVVSKVNSMDDAHYLYDLLKDQKYKKFETLLFLNTERREPDLNKNALIRLFLPLQITVVHNDLCEFKNSIINNRGCTHIAIMDPKNYYGPNYLRDFSLAVQYSDANIFGKKSHFSYNKAKLQRLNQNMEYQYSSSVYTGSSIINKNTFLEMDYFELIGKEVIDSNNSQILSIDPYNLIHGGRNASDSLKKSIRV